MANGINSREEILEYLSDLESHFTIYHNHKEASAWAGIAVFILLLPKLTAVIVKGTSPSCLTTCAATLGIVAITAVVVVYLWQQFALRKRGSDLTAASCYLRAKYIADTTAVVDAKQFAPSTTAQGPMQSSYCLPEAVLKKANELGSQGQASRQTLENCGYALVIFVSLLCVMKLWSATP